MTVAELSSIKEMAATADMTNYYACSKLIKDAIKQAKTDGQPLNHYMYIQIAEEYGLVKEAIELERKTNALMDYCDPEVPSHSSGMTYSERVQRYAMLELCQQYNMPRILSIIQYLLDSEYSDHFIFMSYSILQGENSPRPLIFAKDTTDEIAKKILLNAANSLLYDIHRYPAYPVVERSVVLTWFGLAPDADLLCIKTCGML